MKISGKTETKPLDMAARWLADSGIQSDSGGLYSWYDLEKREYPYLYSEITGYAITTLLFINSIRHDDLLVGKANKAARWLIENSIDSCGGAKARLYSNEEASDKTYSFEGSNMFSFDTGMVLYGFVNLYKATKDNTILKVSERMASFLTDIMQAEDGSIAPMYNAATGKVRENFDKWSSQRGAFHAKVSLGLIDLFLITGNVKYKDSAIKLCDYAISLQDASGRFVTDRKSGTTHLHPHCYTIEGLLYAGASFGRKDFLQSAVRAAKWAFGNVSNTGINELYSASEDKFSDFQRSDILAQLLRIGTMLSMEPEKTDSLASVLLGYQYNGKDALQRGGFLYSKNEQNINSWCTMFALQALALYYNKGLLSKDRKLELFV